MTYRYRCCFCGSSSTTSAKAMRDHVFKAHRRRLLMGLGPIEYFDTREREIAFSRPPTARPDANPGASGEGDS